VPGQYIVVFKDTVGNVPDHAYELARIHGGRPLHVYQHALRGFAVALPEQAAAALSRNPNVAYVEPDLVVSAFDIQSNATWGLDRIDQQNLPLSGTYTHNYRGSGVTAYILDTGIRVTHAEFGGRASHGWDFVDDDATADDCHGHGTHVAGTVGGATYGVAKGVNLVAVRVLDCGGSGTVSGVIAGIDWVTANADRPAVANLSLSGGASTSLDTAVQNSIAAGIGYAVAAGNGNTAGVAQNACNYSPARVPEAMTVSATDITDTKASWANYGSCVDWFAPGVSIRSAYNTGNTATATMTGTSMATPHTTGAAALYLEQYPGATPRQVRDALYAATTKWKVTISNTANNHLLYTLFGGGAPANQSPVAAFTHTTNGLTASFTDTSTDSDGLVTARAWSFGDGYTSNAQNPSRTYATAGTYTVTLTVTDDDGATASISQSVTVASVPVSGITLTVRGYKVKGVKKADLTWSGATGALVTIYRNTALVTTTANDGFHIDTIAGKGGGSYSYKVCAATDPTACSNTVTIMF
jgi:subtilisin family serine protease